MDTATQTDNRSVSTAIIDSRAKWSKLDIEAIAKVQFHYDFTALVSIILVTSGF